MHYVIAINNKRLIQPVILIQMFISIIDLMIVSFGVI